MGFAHSLLNLFFKQYVYLIKPYFLNSTRLLEDILSIFPVNSTRSGNVRLTKIAFRKMAGVEEIAGKNTKKNGATKTTKEISSGGVRSSVFFDRGRKIINRRYPAMTIRKEKCL